MAGLPVLVAGRSLDETVVLAGEGGGVFRLEAGRDCGDSRQFMMAGYPAEGTVRITLGTGDDIARDAEPVGGSLVDAVDSLVVRDPELIEALHGQPERVQQLGMLRAFMLLRVT